MSGWMNYGILFGVGLVAGTLNVIAGGGSFLTLPVLIFLGLPANVANATNRVGIVFQNVGAVWAFQRRRVLPRQYLAWTAIPAVAGSLVGAWAALHISDQAFTRILAVLMIALTLYTLWDPLRRWRGEMVEGSGRQRWLLGVGFVLVGVYGGFVQAGGGFIILAVITMAGIDLVRGNAIKVFCALLFSAVSIAIFSAAGRVSWPEGISLGLGTLLGGQLGVHLTVLKGHRWVRRVVTVAIVVFALKLWLAP